MYIFFPFLGTVRIKKIHRKFNKHHHFNNIQNLSEVHIREMVLDWESGQYSKTNTTTARVYCEQKRPEMLKYMNKYFKKWGI